MPANPPERPMTRAEARAARQGKGAKAATPTSPQAEAHVAAAPSVPGSQAIAPQQIVTQPPSQPHVVALQEAEHHDVMALPSLAAPSLPSPASGRTASAPSSMAARALAVAGAAAAGASVWLFGSNAAIGWVALGLGAVALLAAAALGASRWALVATMASFGVTLVASLFGHGERFGPLLLVELLLGIGLVLAPRRTAGPAPGAKAAEPRPAVTGASRLAIGQVLSAQATAGGIRVQASFADESGAERHVAAEGSFSQGAPRSGDPVVVWYSPNDSGAALLRYNREWADGRRAVLPKTDR